MNLSVITSNCGTFRKLIKYIKSANFVGAQKVNSIGHFSSFENAHTR